MDALNKAVNALNKSENALNKGRKALNKAELEQCHLSLHIALPIAPWRMCYFDSSIQHFQGGWSYFPYK